MKGVRAHHPLTPIAFLLPAVGVLGVFLIWSFVQVIWLSLTDASAFREPQFVGTANYAEVFSRGELIACLVNSAAYLLVTPAIIILSLLTAMVIDARVRGLGWLRVAVFLPVVTPTVVAALAWRALYHEEQGLLNAALRGLGFSGVGWLSERPWTLVSAMLVTLWKGFGFYMLIFLAALMSVPRELKEAASLDGASRWQGFWAVTFPAIRPAVALVFIVSSISALKVFDELFVTVRGVPMSHMTAVPLIYTWAFERGRFGLACAMGVVLFVVILAFSIVQLRLSAGRGDRSARAPRRADGGPDGGGRDGGTR